MGKTKDPVTDPASPYYITDLHSYGFAFLGPPLDLTGYNYFTWDRNLLEALRLENKAGFVDGTIHKPDESSSPMYHLAWLRNDAMVKRWLTFVVSWELQKSVLSADTAREALENLRQRFGQRTGLRTYELHRTIASLRQNGESVDAYFEKLVTALSELSAMEDENSEGCRCGCGINERIAKKTEKEKLFGFLSGLDAKFSTVRSQILLMDPLPSLDRAFVLVSQAEKKQKALSGKRKRHGGAGDGGGKSGGCSHCGKSGQGGDQGFEILGDPPRRGH